ncbi:DNA gyrase subunit A [Candidatus Pelagibacter sp.]|nr:DNA gyrase subunit A [Candidatus Pelagibacter sp.]
MKLKKNGRERLVINSIPYQVNKSILNERIAQLVREKKIEGIKDIRDESNREGIRVSIDLRNGVEPETIKRQLYKNTQIESSFGFNTLAIVDGKPKTCNLKEFLENFLTFREDVVIKKTKFDLQKAEERAHILIGLSVSVENLDKVIKIIRNSKTPDDAKKSILNTKWKINKSQKMISLVEGKKSKSDYSLSEPQVVAILELRLQKLTALGINEIEIEIKKLAELITKYKKIISSKKELLKVISEELKNIKEKFAVPRRTKIIDAVLNYDIEETIQKQSVLITVTLQGYIKRGSIDSVKIQKRGGKGKTGITTRNEDSVVQTLSVDTHTSVLFFSTEGLVYRIKAWKIPEGSSSSKGKSLFNILPLKNHQSISSIMPFPEGDENLNDYQIIFATAKGKVRKNSLEDFASINASGKIAMKLDANDKIVGVKICKDNQDAILSTKLGKCIRFETKKLRIFKGRSSKGIKGIELAPNDEIISLSVINNDKTNKNGKKSKDDKAEIKASEVFILSITENGYGKKTSHYDYRVTNRGGKGIIGIVNSPRNGNISSSFPVYEGDEVMISTNKGRVIRVAVKEIRTAGRNTQGVRIIKLTGDEKVVSAIKIEDNLI